MEEFSWNSRSMSTSTLLEMMHHVIPPTTYHDRAELRCRGKSREAVIIIIIIIIIIIVIIVIIVIIIIVIIIIIIIIVIIIITNAPLMRM